MKENFEVAGQKVLLVLPMFIDKNVGTGIWKKNVGIASAFKQNGYEVDRLEFSTKDVRIGAKVFYVFSRNRVLRRLQYQFLCWNVLADPALCNYSFVWFRVPVPIVGAYCRFLKMVRNASASGRVILEFGAYPYANELTFFNKILYNIGRRLEGRLFNHADFVVTYCEQVFLHGKPVIPITNGYSGGYCHEGLTKSGSSKTTIVCVSSFQRWHGIDRLINGVGLYVAGNASVEVEVLLVGDGEEFDRAKSLIKSLSLEGVVFLLGRKFGIELEEIYARSHIAIGSLGAHRIGLNSLCSLKVREYLAFGLPVVLSSVDRDLVPESGFVHYVSADEHPIDLHQVIEFVKSVYKNPSISTHISNFARRSLTWDSKIRSALRFMQDQ